MQLIAEQIDDFFLDVTKKTIEGVNEQFRITKRKLDQDQFEWSMLSNPEKSDMHTRREHILKKYERYGNDFWNTWPACFDPGCGDGEFLAVWQEKLREAGCPDAEIAKRVFWADPEHANIMLTAQRLGISIDNGFSYQVGKVEETYVNKRGVIKTREVDITQKSFEEGLNRMTFDINKVNVVGNLPFTYGKGNAPVAVPVLLNLLDKGIPQTINLVQHMGFMPSNEFSEFRKNLYESGMKFLGENDPNLFSEGNAKVRTVDIFCERGHKGNIIYRTLDGNAFDYDFKSKDIIVSGGTLELTEFLYSLLDKTKSFGFLRNRNTKNPSYKELDAVAVDFPTPGYEPYLSKMSVSGDIIKYAPAEMFVWKDDINSWRSVHGYRPSGLEYGDKRIGRTTKIPPGVHLPGSPNLYFKGTATEEHVDNLDRYIHSGPIEKFVLQMTRENKTFDAKTISGVTKFIPALPEGVTIKNDDDVFDFLETPEHIREAVRARF
jgi:hypothetical protein